MKLGFMVKVVTMILLGSLGLMGEEERKSLAWLGHLRLPKTMLVEKKTVQPTSPFKWKNWSDHENEEIDWIPRHKGYVNVLGRSLKVLPKGVDPVTLSRRKRHQANL